MDMAASPYEVADAVLEGEDLDEVLARSRSTTGGGGRRHSAEDVYEVLDIYEAVIDGVPVPAARP